MKKIILFFFLIYSGIALSKIDLKFSTDARSYPSFGSKVSFEVGKNIILWQKKPDDQIFRTMLRPYIDLNTSVFINSREIGLEIFPLSFLEIKVGQSVHKINTNMSFFNCSEIICQGNLTRNFIKGKIALAYKNFFLLSSYGIEYIETLNDNLNFGDYSNVLILNPKNESIRSTEITGGYSWGHYSAGIYRSLNSTQNHGSKNSIYLAFFKKEINKLSISFAAGKMSPTITKGGTMLALQIEYIPKKSLKLF